MIGSLFSSMTLTNITYVTAHVSLSRLKMIYYKLLNLLVVITHLDMLVFFAGNTSSIIQHYDSLSRWSREFNEDEAIVEAPSWSLEPKKMKMNTYIRSCET